MNYIICEGKHDTIFFEELITKRLNLNHCLIKEEFEKIQKIYRSSSDFYCATYHWILYRDTGKDEIKKYIIPKLITDIHGKYKNERFLVVIDDDHIQHVELIKIIYDKVSEILTTKEIPYLIINYYEDGNCIITISEKNTEFKIIFKFVFVPGSLEKKIVQKSIEKYSNNFCDSEIVNLKKDPPHDAIRKICSKLSITKDLLIRQSVENDWFIDEDWFITLNRIVKSGLN